MIDPTELRQWLDSLAADDPIRVAFTERRFAECNEICNAKTEPGYIPARSIISTLSDRGKWPGMEIVYKHLFGQVPVEIYGACCQVVLIKDSLVWSVPLRPPVAQIQQAGVGLIAANLATQEDLDAVLSHEIKISPVEEQFGYDKSVTAELLERVSNS